MNSEIRGLLTMRQRLTAWNGIEYIISNKSIRNQCMIMNAVKEQWTETEESVVYRYTRQVGIKC